MKRPDPIRIALFLVLAGLVFVMFDLKGNATSVTMYSRSAFRWMVHLWYYTSGYGGANYTQGWLIPLVSLWLAWRRRKEIAAAAKRVSYSGLAVVVVALLLHWIGVKSQQTRLSLVAFIMFLWGVPFYLYGWPTARLLMFPVGFLIFCIPLNFFDSVLFPLRILSVRMATGILNGLGIESTSSGSAVYLGGDEGISFEMADPASSIRMVLAAAAFATALAYVMQLDKIRVVLLAAISVPLALLANIVRILVICLLAEGFGPEFSRKVFENGSSAITYVAAFAMIYGAGILLRNLTSDRIQAWKGHLTTPSSS